MSGVKWSRCQGASGTVDSSQERQDCDGAGPEQCSWSCTVCLRRDGRAGAPQGPPRGRSCGGVLILATRPGRCHARVRRPGESNDVNICLCEGEMVAMRRHGKLRSVLHRAGDIVFFGSDASDLEVEVVSCALAVWIEVVGAENQY